MSRSLLRSCYLVALTAFVAACGDGTTRGRLPATSDTTGHPALLIALPDSGGYTLNGQPIPADSIAFILASILGPRTPLGRRVFVWDNPKRPWKDVELVSEAAAGIGGIAYDAEASGWPHEIPAPAAMDNK